MKAIIFKRLSVHDFKGISERTIDFSDNITVIYGPNYSGKTSLLDALYWVLFGKSLTGDTRFGVVPIGKDDATPCVTLTLVVDGEDHTLARRLLDGSKTDCTIDSAPVKVGDYENWVADNIMPIDRFKLFSNPVYFASLSWQEQRALFTGFFENLPREDVLNLMQREGKEVSTEFRIRSEKQSAENIIEAMKREIRELDTTKSKHQGAAEYLAREISAAGEISVDALKAERDGLMEQFDKAVETANNAQAKLDKLADARRVLHGLQQDAENIKFEIREKDRDKQTKIARIRQLIADVEAKIQRKAIEWKEAEARPVPDMCPTCGQPFPDGTMDAAQQAKDKIIADLEGEGNALRKQINDYKADLTDAQNIEFPELTRALVEKEVEIKKQGDAVKKLESALPAPPKPVHDIRARIDEIGVQIAYASEVEYKKLERKDLLDKIQKLVVGIEIREHVKKDAEQFIQYRALATVEAVNSQFARVRIELYDYPKNGDPKPTFRLLYGGVNFGDTSSTERVLLGLEINDYLKKAMDVSIPTIIDNFESYISIAYDALPKQSIISMATDDDALCVMSR